MKKEKVSLPYSVPREGSLGLLALGARGIRQWRKVRDEKTNRKESN